MPNDQTPEERGFQEGMRYVPGGNLDAGWHKSSSSWCPYTFNITIRTVFVGLLAWLVGMFAESLQGSRRIGDLPPGDMAVVLVVWFVFFLCIAAAIALPIVSLKALNWAGQLFWIFFFFYALVLKKGPTATQQVLLFTIVGSAVSEVVVRFWLQNSNEETLFTYRVRTIGRLLVRGALVCAALGWIGISAYRWYEYTFIGSVEGAKYLEQRRQEEAADEAAEKAKKESAPVPPQTAPSTEPQVPAQPAAVPTPVTTPSVPTREPDAKFSFPGQPTADSPPTRHFVFNDIQFESGDGPTSEARKQVIADLRRGIEPERRFARSDMWPSNVAIATDLAAKNLQRDADQLAGMECRAWVLDYGLLLLGDAIFMNQVRLQVICSR